MRFTAVFFLLLVHLMLQAQRDSLPPIVRPAIEISGYVETYTAVDATNPGAKLRPPFYYSFNRQREWSINMAMIKVAFTSNRIRANAAAMAGTYSISNLAEEPGVLKNVYELNAGIKLLPRQELWLEAGVFASHIGFESAIGKDCPTLTRSILADNSPYYESGAKLSYTTANGKLYAAFLLLNGWQRIRLLSSHTRPSYGWQLLAKPTDQITLNSSSFIGYARPDSLQQLRLFHNFYALIAPVKNLQLTIGLDVGAEQAVANSKKYLLWYAPIFISRYQVIPKLALAFRYEYYRDIDNVVISSSGNNGFDVMGYSLNADVLPFANAMLRLEVKALQSLSGEEFIRKGNMATRWNVGLCASFSYSFNHVFNL